MENSSIGCPVCRMENVSLKKIAHNMSNEILSYFTPLPQHLESLLAISQFQYSGMSERIVWQKRCIERLLIQNKKQKDLLISARDELLLMQDYKSKILALQKENSTLRFKIKQFENFNEVNVENKVEKTNNHEIISSVEKEVEISLERTISYNSEMASSCDADNLSESTNIDNTSFIKYGECNLSDNVYSGNNKKYNNCSTFIKGPQFIVANSKTHHGASLDRKIKPSNHMKEISKNKTLGIRKPKCLKKY